jgi:signal transduction histidine kinase/CheY-like chemotaxis protein
MAEPSTHPQSDTTTTTLLPETSQIAAGPFSPAQRLAAVRASGLLDTPPEPVFDRLTEMVRKILHVPVALVSLVDVDRQFFKSASGLPPPLTECRQTPLSHSFCQHVAYSGEPLVVVDARCNPIVCENSAVAELGVVAYLGVPLRAVGGEAIGSLCAIDIQPRQWTAEDFEVLTTLASAAMAEITLRAQMQSKDRFLAVLSHELRTPLTPVLMSLTSLESTELPDLVREDLHMMRRNIELEIRLIDDLLDLSRVASGKLALSFQPVDLHEAIGHVCGICRPQLQEKAIRLQFESDAALGQVSADPARLQQVLWNVLKNAIKFTPQGGEIRIVTQPVGLQRVRIEIRDSGMGIRPELLTRIFDAFEQGDSRTTLRFGGMGLGLAISKALVEMHQGNIWAQSAGEGSGSTFVIELPLENGSPISVTKPLPAAIAKSSGLRLLIVEDHIDTARVLGRLLRAEGYAVQTANTVAEALHLAAEHEFDVVVSDVGLPDATGYELIQQLKSQYSVKGIAMSGYGMEDDLRKSRAAGFSEHLVKPVDISRLAQAIQRVSSHR